MDIADCAPLCVPRDGREQEIAELTAQGKIPHEVELEKHPEKSMEGRMCRLLIAVLLDRRI